MGDLDLKQEGAVLWVTLSRPEKKNAVTLEMWEGLAAAFTDAEVDASVRVVVVRGAGGNFSSGADLTGAGPKEGSSGGGGTLEAKITAMLRKRVAPAALALNRLSKPTIALVEGVAAGAGCNLALGCDLVYAADDARFCQIFVRRALSLDFGASWILPRRVGLQKAKEMALLGEFVAADEALSLGLIAGVAKGDEIDALVRDRADRLARQAPLAMALIKRSLEESADLSFADAVDREFVLQAQCTASADFAEGVRAFLEKREPRFGGS